ncbi:thrombospondin type-1 domain-containing protein 4-like [Protopterus annectens]|uniref:thrombospondin type-1 domain-containing protein 4-like n=1 Tax=Protopterus annectens TaxID=7888 RepID=UPI001CF9B73A|nr:thrombospondin type-1 domain-containing protein 4-like [Protopterus annectens]
MRHNAGCMCRMHLTVFVYLCILVNQLSFAHRKVPQRKLRQAPDEEDTQGRRVPGHWSTWSPWSRCSHPCGTGIVERSRTCLSPSAANPQEHVYMGPSLGSLPQQTPVSPYDPFRQERMSPYTGHGYAALRPSYPLHTDRNLAIPSAIPPPSLNRYVGNRQSPFYRSEGPNRNSRQDSLSSQDLSRVHGRDQAAVQIQSHGDEHVFRQDTTALHKQQDISTRGSLSLYKPSGVEDVFPHSQDNRSSLGSLFQTSPLSQRYQSVHLGDVSEHRNYLQHGSVRQSQLQAHSTQQPHTLKRIRQRGPIKPGTFGYGKVPFSLPLLKKNELGRRSRRNSQLQKDDAAHFQGHAERQDLGSEKRQHDRSGSSRPPAPKTLHIHTKSGKDTEMEALKTKTTSLKQNQNTELPTENGLQATEQTATIQPFSKNRQLNEGNVYLAQEETLIPEEKRSSSWNFAKERHIEPTDGKELSEFLGNYSRIVAETQPEEGLDAPQLQESLQQEHQTGSSLGNHSESSRGHGLLKGEDSFITALVKEVEYSTHFERNNRTSETTQNPFLVDWSSVNAHQHLKNGIGLKETPEISSTEVVFGKNERMDKAGLEEVQKLNKTRNRENLGYFHRRTLESQQPERILGTGVVHNSKKVPQAVQRSHFQGVQYTGNQTSLSDQYLTYRNPNRNQNKHRLFLQSQQLPQQVARSDEFSHLRNADRSSLQSLQREPIVHHGLGSQTRTSQASRTRQHRQHQHGVYDILTSQDYRLSAAQPIRQGQEETDRWNLRTNVPWNSPQGSPNRLSPYSNAEIQDWSLYNPDAGNFICEGEQKQYKVCNQEPCPAERPSFRATQCASFNKQEFMGRLYEWEPFTEVRQHQRCELNCRPVGYRFYVRHAEKVQDGTPCELNSKDVCIAGRCLTPGCDGILGSNKTDDKCGICGGDSSSCKFVSGIFDDASVPIGYHRIIEIPKGATKINITEKTASPNYLALRTHSGKSVVNGNWAVDQPGQYKAGGTVFQYSRPTSMEVGESFTAEGPTSESMDVYMIFQEKNPGITYEFFLPTVKPDNPAHVHLGPRQQFNSLPPAQSTESLQAPPRLQERVPNVRNPNPVSRAAQSGRSHGTLQRNVRIPPQLEPPIQLPPHQQEFFWKRVGSTQCSASCGKGSHFPIFRCVSRSTLEEYGDRNCDISAKPSIIEEACNTHPCPAFWDAGEWSECSKTCGQGIQHRQVICRQFFANRTTMVQPQLCGQLEKPPITQSCQVRICSHWEVGTSWSSCSVLCGVGQRTRSLRCVSSTGDLIADGECNQRQRPNTVETCDMGPCVKSWFHSDWSKMCSVECGPGVQRRSVVCLSSQTDGLSQESCSGPKPADMQVCNNGPCERQVKWFTGPWNQCSTECGVGTQRRDIICISKLGTDFKLTDPSECVHLEKPASIQPCEIESCKARWYTTQWSTCSKSCQGGVQMREVRCLTEEKAVSDLCDPEEKPVDKQECNTQPCSLELGESCKDEYHSCAVVVQARLCVYSYYKTVCCASCARAEERRTRRTQ